MKRYFETKRLICRQLTSDDLNNLIAVHSDPKMSQFYPVAFTATYVAGFLERVLKAQDRNGYCFAGLIEKSSSVMVGVAGLNYVAFEAPFTPAVEVGWRIAVPHWGCGYASEAGAGALSFGFAELKMDEIVAFAVPANKASTRVMTKIGMRHLAGADFEHPDIPGGFPFSTHVLYRLTADEWRENQQAV